MFPIESIILGVMEATMPTAQRSDCCHRLFAQIDGVRVCTGCGQLCPEQQSA